MYTWRHNQVLEVLSETLNAHCNAVNAKPASMTASGMQFIREGKPPPRAKRQGKHLRLLCGASDWKVRTDLGSALRFPDHITLTNERPDIVIWSDSLKRVLLIELTVPWEGNMEYAYERKKTRYETLRSQCEERGWSCHVLPVEVGCRGFVARSMSSLFAQIGLSSCDTRKTNRSLQCAAERASCWIWTRARKS